jgi:hypothetical protein
MGTRPDQPLPGQEARGKLSLADTIRSVVINKNTLLASNRRSAAEVTRWIEKRDAGELFMVYSCSDSRELPIFPGDDSIMYPTIAAAGHDHKEKSRIPHKGKIIATHYPCGGAHAKELHKNEDITIPETGLHDYVKHKIKDANVVEQALMEAEEASRNSDEPVLAVVVDQANADIIPIAYMQKDKPTIMARDIKKFNPADTHSLQGLPRLDIENLGIFKEYLEKCKTHADSLKGEFPDFSKTQGSQNPPILILDTEKNPPLSTRFDILRYPGIAFRISNEGDRDQAEEIRNFETALDQAEYPLDNFTNLKTTLIQAIDGSKARELAKAFLERPKGRAWLSKPGRELIVASGKDGIIDPESVLVITDPHHFRDSQLFPVFSSPPTSAV